MKYFYKIFILLLIFSSCHGGFIDPAYLEVINNPLKGHRNPEVMISQLLFSISGYNDFEKVRAIHDWIIMNVEYDYPLYYSDALSYYNGLINSQSYYNVLATGLAVCGGYANLFKELCDRVKIPCVKI